MEFLIWLPGGVTGRGIVKDGFRIRKVNPDLVNFSNEERAVLYGVSKFLSKIAREESIVNLDEQHESSAPVRRVDQ